jgi:CRP-like cAMP-binding protein
MGESLDLILFLDKVDIFKNLSLEELGQIASIAETARFEAGETLFEPGDPGNHAYIIVSGKIDLFLEDDRGRRQILTHLMPGTCFGEMALLDGEPRSAGASIAEKSLLMVLSREDFLRVLKRYPSIAQGIIAQLSLRLRQTNSQLNTLRSAAEEFRSLYGRIKPILEDEE